MRNKVCWYAKKYEHHQSPTLESKVVIPYVIPFSQKHLGKPYKMAYSQGLN